MDEEYWREALEFVFWKEDLIDLIKEKNVREAVKSMKKKKLKGMD